MNTDSRQRPSWIYWVYFALVMLPALAHMIRKLLTDTGGFSSRYFGLIFTVILVSGAIGYLRRRPLLRRWVWALVFWLSMAISLFLALLCIYLLVTEGPAISRLCTAIAGGLLLIIPAQIMLFRYAYRSEDIWRVKE